MFFVSILCCFLWVLKCLKHINFSFLEWLFNLLILIYISCSLQNGDEEACDDQDMEEEQEEACDDQDMEEQEEDDQEDEYYEYYDAWV